MYQIRIVDAAARDLARLDPTIGHRIVNRIRWLAENLDDVRPEALTGDLAGFRQAIQFIAGGGKAYTVEHIRQQHPNAYARWTEEEDSSLREEYGQGKVIGELVRQFGRQPGAIQSRLRRLGLV
jgi:hypothetical protein